MSDLPDLFPGFASERVAVGGAELFLRTGGEGPPLVLLHGYPQTHACWSRVAAVLKDRFTLVIPDLRGYGASSIPDAAETYAYSKRAMAQDIVDLMARLGHERFALAGHDRGARVAYRLALDHPGVVTRLAVLDVVPTLEMWAAMDARMALKAYHWAFLAQPSPLPETLISADPMLYLEHTLASWTGSKSLAPFAPEALAHYRAFFGDPLRVAACCADYRAGASVDVSHDEADRETGRLITAPLLALWGEKGFPGQIESPLDIWRSWATDVRGHGLPCGHFLPEEAPDETAAALLEFFAA